MSIAEQIGLWFAFGSLALIVIGALLAFMRGNAAHEAVTAVELTSVKERVKDLENDLDMESAERKKGDSDLAKLLRESGRPIIPIRDNAS